jgi:hypothetical protein
MCRESRERAQESRACVERAEKRHLILRTKGDCNQLKPTASKRRRRRREGGEKISLFFSKDLLV